MTELWGTHVRLKGRGSEGICCKWEVWQLGITRRVWEQVCGTYGVESDDGQLMAMIQAGLQSISYRSVAFILMVLYQVGGSSCSAWERVGPRGFADRQVMASSAANANPEL